MLACGAIGGPNDIHCQLALLVELNRSIGLISQRSDANPPDVVTALEGGQRAEFLRRQQRRLEFSISSIHATAAFNEVAEAKVACWVYA